MGWTFLRKANFEGWQKLVERGVSYEDAFVRIGLLSSVMVGRALYGAVQVTPKSGEASRIGGIVVLTSATSDERGYKLMSEDMGPYESSAPAKILDLLTQTESASALNWRSRCRRNLHRAAQAAHLEVGSIFQTAEPLRFRLGDRHVDVASFQLLELRRGMQSAICLARAEDAGLARFRCIIPNLKGREFASILRPDGSPVEEPGAEPYVFRNAIDPVLARRHTNPDGSVGGYVALSAWADPEAYVGPNAEVAGRSGVYARARIGGAALIAGDSEIGGFSVVEGRAVVRSSSITDHVLVFGDAELTEVDARGHAQIYGQSVSHKASIYGTRTMPAKVGGRAWIRPDLPMGRAASVISSRIDGDAVVIGSGVIADGSHIGCETKIDFGKRESDRISGLTLVESPGVERLAGPPSPVAAAEHVKAVRPAPSSPPSPSPFRRTRAA